MRVVVLALSVLVAAASRPGCGEKAAVAPCSPSDPGCYDPCAGRACGDACQVCPPDATDCAETAVVKACDPEGRCVPATPGLCDAAACAGKACGDACVYDPPCRAAVPPCAMPSTPGHCDAAGSCTPDPAPTPLCPSWGCAGKACGDACGFCPPDTDPRNCPVPTFAPTACDARLQCVTEGTFTCPPP